MRLGQKNHLLLSIAGWENTETRSDLSLDVSNSFADCSSRLPDQEGSCEFIEQTSKKNQQQLIL
jgi:hypothetical protein